MTEKLVTWIITVVGFGTTITLLKMWLTTLGQKIDAVEKEHRGCRDELPGKYANKQEVINKLQLLSVKTDKAEAYINYMKGVSNGKKKE